MSPHPSNLPWHKRYHSDALTGYLPLSLEERGAYTTLLDMMYDRGEGLGDSDRVLAIAFGVSVRKARSLIASLEAKGKIVRDGEGRLTNPRFEKECENALERSRKAAEIGSKGGRKSAERWKKPNQFNTGEQRTLERGLSHTRSQNPEQDFGFEDPLHWPTAVKNFHTRGLWAPEWGPPPGTPGCRAPECPPSPAEEPSNGPDEKA